MQARGGWPAVLAGLLATRHGLSGIRARGLWRCAQPSSQGARSFARTRPPHWASHGPSSPATTGPWRGFRAPPHTSQPRSPRSAGPSRAGPCTCMRRGVLPNPWWTGGVRALSSGATTARPLASARTWGLDGTATHRGRCVRARVQPGRGGGRGGGGRLRWNVPHAWILRGAAPGPPPPRFESLRRAQRRVCRRALLSRPPPATPLRAAAGACR